ncbi:hypothetical protein C8A00DRAFT_36038 [Chaetomidium leptoderma]|uniref:RRM domain-containing protein n=1 Tax=Chaetomidium leptoderma TaxID=669021 RepID=A0AAN6VH15_9PEZI|nr:hypothetical protein C8A00DRAFT_36038 [Chaetomidium leptoderma]
MAEEPIRQARVPFSSNVGWYWGITDNNMMIPQPVMGFYWDIPSDARHSLSANKERRSYNRGDVPARAIMAWDDDVVREVTAAFRAARGPEMQNLVRPETWDDMYQYFDAIDLWHEGAWNLWRVLHLACDQNDGTAVGSLPDPTIFDTVNDSSYDWCTHEENRNRLANWDQRSDILCILSPADLENINGCTIDALNILRGALEYWHYVFEPAANAERLSDIDIAQVSSPTRAQDDNGISLPWLPGRSRRRSNSLPSVSSSITLHDTLPFVYTPNPAVLIVNGTTPSHPHQPFSGIGSTERTAGNLVRKGHQSSQSGPASMAVAGHRLTARGAGVEDSGPSRLPRGSQRLSSQDQDQLASSSQDQDRLDSDHAPINVHSPCVSHPEDSAQSHGDSNGSQVQSGSQRCLNDTGGPARWRHAFVSCPCSRCTRMSSSIHVTPVPMEYGREQAENILRQYFGRWGYIEEFTFKRASSGNHYAFIRYKSDLSARRAVTAMDGEAINSPPLVGARVTYPHYSRYFQYQSRSRPGSNGSRPSMGGQHSPLGGHRDSPPWDSQHPRQQLGTPPRPQRCGNRGLPAPDRSRSMMHHGRPTSSSWGHGPWAAHPQASPPGIPQFPMPPMPYGPPPQVYPGPHPHHGWPNMPMPPGPVPPGPLVYHAPVTHYHGFPFPPPQFVPHPPLTNQGPPQPQYPQPEPRQDQPPPVRSSTASPAHSERPNDERSMQTEPPYGECSMQTKPPYEEAFEDAPSLTKKNSGSSTHSSAGSPSIRVRLPGTTSADPEPAETPVRIPRPNEISWDSPVRRITFGDFVPDEAPPSPAAERAEDCTAGCSEDHPAERAEDCTAGCSEDHPAGCTELPTTPPIPQPVTHTEYQTSQDPALARVNEDYPTEPFAWQLDESYSSARRISGDVRLDASYNGTVIRRRRQPGRIPSFWEPNFDSSPPWEGNNAAHWEVPRHELPGGPFHQQYNGPAQAFNGPAPQLFNGPTLHPFNDPTPHPFNGPAPHLFNGPAHLFNGPDHPFNGSAPHPFNGSAPHPFNGSAPYPFNGFAQPSNSAYGQQFSGGSQPLNGGAQPFNGTYDQPPNGAYDQGFNEPQQQPPNGHYRQLYRPPQDPQPELQHQSDEPGPSNPKTKKKKKTKNKNKPGLNSQAQSRSTTPLPLPPTNGDTTHEEPQRGITGPSSLPNGNSIKGKGKAVATARPTTPENQGTTTRISEDDIYNATPKKDKGKGKATSVYPSQEPVNSAEPATQNGDPTAQNGGVPSTNTQPQNGTGGENIGDDAMPKKDKGKERAPGRKPTGHGQVGDNNENEKKKKKSGSDGNKAGEKKAAGGGDNNNKTSDRKKGGAEHEKAKTGGDQHPKPDDSITTAPITAPGPSIAPTTAGGSGGEKKKPGPGPAGGYRADAGGSLRIPRHRRAKNRNGGGGGARVDVRDVFKDQQEY